MQFLDQPPSASTSQEAVRGFGRRSGNGETVQARFDQVEGASANAQNPLEMVHRLLRGRYVIAVLGGLLLGTAGAWLGWRLPKPMYKSEALVQVKYYQPHAQPDEAVPFDVFMQSQQTLITSRRVVERALHQPEWQSLRMPVTPAAIQGFASNLVVEVKPRTEYLKITYSDEDPVVARDAVRSVTNAYASTFEEDEQNIKAAYLKLWKQRRDEHLRSVETEQKELQSVVDAYGTIELGPMHAAAMDRADRLDQAIDDLHVEMAAARGPGASIGVVALPTTRPVDGQVALTPEQIAETDPQMKRLLDDEHQSEDQVESLKAFGLGDSHRDVVRAKYFIEKAKERVDRYAGEYNAIVRARAQAAGPGPSDVSTNGPHPSGHRSMAELVKSESELLALRRKAQEEMVKLETARFKIEQLQATLRKNREELEAINQRIVAFEGQDQLGGRLTVINAGEVPLSPVRDLRGKLSAAGGFAGAILPAGLIAALAMLRRRYRFADETVVDLSSRAPLLGILPQMADSSDAGVLAAQRVHHIRVLLQPEPSDRQSRSYLITSASAGEGKTSLTMALGLSFAATGLRTLVIDGDLVGRRLTRGIDAVDSPGFYEAIQAGSIKGCLRRTIAGLYVLPVGGGDIFEACAVSAAALKKIMTEVKRYFDIVLVDSGPVLGSVEASLLAQDVDGVLLTVARGQQPPLVNRALRHLDSLGVALRGFVFNRAHAADYDAEYTSSSRGDLAVQSKNLYARTEHNCRLGPLVAAVISSLPAMFQPNLG